MGVIEGVTQFSNGKTSNIFHKLLMINQYLIIQGSPLSFKESLMLNILNV